MFNKKNDMNKMKKMGGIFFIRIIFILSISFLLVGCENDSAKQAAQKNINYTISEDTHQGNIKRRVVVVLDERVDEIDLVKLANTIKKSDKSKYDRTFIGYYLKGREGDGYWATTNFDPDVKIQILGLSKEEENRLTQSVVTRSDKNVLGVWIDDRPGVGAKITIYYSNEGKLYLESSYPDGSSGKKEMIYFAVPNGKRIEDKDGNEFDEYFVINKANQLEFWSKKTNHYTAKKIQ